MTGGKEEPSIDEITVARRPVSAAEFDSRAAEARQLIDDGELAAGQAEQLASWTAAQFWASYLSDGCYSGDAITLLCEIAAQRDPLVAQAAREAIFSSLVEPLSDAFDPQYCALYDRMFAEVIDWCRRQPEGEAFHRQLGRFGLHTPQDLLERKRGLDASPAEFRGDPERVRKVILLSRVTLGAEVAVVATLISNVRNVFPNAQYVLLATPGIGQMFAGDDQVSVREVQYRREAALVEQFSPWRKVVQAIRSETEGLQPHEFIVIDPDSRLTQLGLLPVVNDESHYHLFPSRSFGGDGTESIAELANRWANQTFGNSAYFYPQLSLSQTDWDIAQALRQHLDRAGASHVVTVNYGVGGNAIKRFSEDFEQGLVLKLLESGSHIVLARGVGPEEIARSGRLLGTMKRKGRQVLELDATDSDGSISEVAQRSDILAWQGNVGAYCALIGNSDEYIGYDSAGQHIAAALGVPAVDIFAHSPNPVFIKRWRPYGQGIVHVVDATIHDRSERPDIQAVIEQVMAHHETTRST